MTTFKEDRIEYEKDEPIEGTSIRFIYVPIALISIFLVFGVYYLLTKTQDSALNPGDSRTLVSQQESTTPTAAAPSASEENLSTLMEKGKVVYTTTCQACHQAAGTGVPGAFPPLAKSSWVNGSPKRLVAIVLHGLQGEINVNGQKFQGVMPPLKDQLSSTDVAAVATYVKNSFGNDGGLVVSDLVNQVREETKARTASWNGESELSSQKWD